jgi:hypothetical protein
VGPKVAQPRALRYSNWAGTEGRGIFVSILNA